MPRRNVRRNSPEEDYELQIRNFEILAKASSTPKELKECAKNLSTCIYVNGGQRCSDMAVLFGFGCCLKHKYLLPQSDNTLSSKKKQAPKKQAPKKQAPKKQAPKKQAPKKQKISSDSDSDSDSASDIPQLLKRKVVSTNDTISESDVSDIQDIDSVSST